MDDSRITHMQKSSWFFQMLNDWFQFQANFLREYGWRLLGGLITSVMFWNWLEPRVQAWLRAREDAAYHKDPDRVLAREEALARARAQQAERLQAESARKAELQKEKEEQKKREAAELLERYGHEGGGRHLGSTEDGYLPLSGGGGAGSSYRAPRRSACSRGGCGR